MGTWRDDAPPGEVGPVASSGPPERRPVGVGWEVSDSRRSPGERRRSDGKFQIHSGHPGAAATGGWLAADADLLIHDSQYDTHEYLGQVGWGHSSLKHMLDFATLTNVAHLVPFHHDPGHSDADIDRLMREAIAEAQPAYRVTPGLEGAMFEV